MDLFQEVMHESYTGVWSWWIYGVRNVNDIKRCSVFLAGGGGTITFGWKEKKEIVFAKNKTNKMSMPGTS